MALNHFGGDGPPLVPWHAASRLPAPDSPSLSPGAPQAAPRLHRSQPLSLARPSQALLLHCCALYLWESGDGRGRGRGRAGVRGRPPPPPPRAIPCPGRDCRLSSQTAPELIRLNAHTRARLRGISPGRGPLSASDPSAFSTRAARGERRGRGALAWAGRPRGTERSRGGIRPGLSELPRRAASRPGCPRHGRPRAAW